LLAILTPKGIIQFASAGFTRLLGYSTEDLAGESILAVIHPDDAGERANAFASFPSAIEGN